MGLGLVVLGIYIFKNIWVLGILFSQFRCLILGVSWSPNAEILKQSSEVAILKTYDLKFTFQRFNNSRLGITFTIGLHSIHTKIYTYCLCFIDGDLHNFTFQKKQKTLYLLWIAIMLKTIFVLYFSAQFRFFY